MIGDATLEDVPRIAELEATCLGDDAWSEHLVELGATGDLPTVHYLVARRGTQVVGYAVASHAGDIAELQRIAVDPADRRRGIAGELLAEVVRRADGSGADRLLLEVREDNAGALAFYAASGFTEVDRRRRYYRDGATAVVLRRGLGRGCGGGA
ncbi:MAG TPA: ribosomal protein S18-alanine N-acetyltransferase [Marmoricola sp.]|nr:ribosomal protein S18-alanine N-acetyltransferase [Marmoricola sp.]